VVLFSTRWPREVRNELRPKLTGEIGYRQVHRAGKGRFTEIFVARGGGGPGT
jgi:hypothetical protein